ncbi:plasmid mobilization relaxosome protein MobC [Agrobacterium genomosp. 3]|uniref:plasmid mobilization protein n=1 Tax=Agrobacterium tomkonis TaxID=1183410 RepID=UPI001CD8AFDC|nr:plasmid mobilization relaxosome protein MobC [Agrobacterium tomkonis]MCA1878835.1 plasmid mobilization relaxosome protein MobC [Agrobacterium tumefaciens]MCA1894083.1 plasmid mobilization relaxosome protein MobC [Agrobacterium tomkonis]
MAKDGSKKRRGNARSGLGRQVNVRFSEAEYEALDAAAQKAEMTVSGFFRSLSLEGAGVRPIFNDEDRTILSILHEDMRKIGVNLNQVARSLNAGRVVDPEEIKIALRNVERITDATRQELRHASVRAGNSRRGEA